MLAKKFAKGQMNFRVKSVSYDKIVDVNVNVKISSVDIVFSCIEYIYMKKKNKID